MKSYDQEKYINTDARKKSLPKRLQYKYWKEKNHAVQRQVGKHTFITVAFHDYKTYLFRKKLHFS